MYLRFLVTFHIREDYLRLYMYVERKVKGYNEQ